jgi:hypothetical protein
MAAFHGQSVDQTAPAPAFFPREEHGFQTKRSHGNVVIKANEPVCVKQMFSLNRVPECEGETA